MLLTKKRKLLEKNLPVIQEVNCPLDAVTFCLKTTDLCPTFGHLDKRRNDKENGQMNNGQMEKHCPKNCSKCPQVTLGECWTKNGIPMLEADWILFFFFLG